jgi:hypothetical protein
MESTSFSNTTSQRNRCEWFEKKFGSFSQQSSRFFIQLERLYELRAFWFCAIGGTSEFNLVFPLGGEGMPKEVMAHKVHHAIGSDSFPRKYANEVVAANLMFASPEWPIRHQSLFPFAVVQLHQTIAKTSLGFNPMSALLRRGRARGAGRA